jgi:hypothetical protein
VTTPSELDGQAHELGNGRIQFGAAAGNTIPADWAAPLLRRIHDRHPAAFGKILMEYYAEVRLGQALTVTRARQRKE